MRLRVIESTTTDPFYNVALEQALHELAPESSQPILRYWKNTPSVIIGRVQDLSREVNQDFCSKHQIPIIRRISGGGTVYHDLGNLNISLILPISMIPTETNVQAFSIYCTKQIMQTLRKLGIEQVNQEGETNIFLDDTKISGSAGHLRRGWFLHHATLLFSTDLEKLNTSLLARESYPDDPKASRYFLTQNLENLSEEQWKTAFTQYISQELELSPSTSEVTPDEHEFALKLQHQLYEDENWTSFGKRKLIRP